MPVNDFVSKIVHIKDYVDQEKLAVRVVKLDTQNCPGFDFKPGQFVMIYVDEVKNPMDASKPKFSSMSICSAPHEKGFIELCMRMHEKPGPSVSRFIGENSKIGSIVKIKGPFGVFGLTENQKHAVFASTGTGIAPLMSMLRHLVFKKFAGKIVFFYGCRNQNDFLYRQELEKIGKQNKNLDLQVIFSREKFNKKQGYVQDLIKNYNFPPEKEQTHFYLCGNPQAVQQEKDTIASLGFKPENMHDEKW